MSNRSVNLATRLLKRTIALAAVPLLFAQCSSSPTPPATPAPAQYVVTYLTADAPGSTALSTDPVLLNPWGLTFTTDSTLLWVADNHSGVATDYNIITGVNAGGSVSILQANSQPGGTPSGMILAPTTNPFSMPIGGAPIYLFSTEDGTIAGWNLNIASKPATILVNHSTNGAVYKGLAALSANSGTTSNLWVTNFHVNQVEEYDARFNYIGTAITSAKAPNLNPFNIVNIGGKMFVTCARPKASGMDDSAGVGIGAVVTFDGQNGQATLFASGGTLNSPWGVAKAPSTFGKYANDILIGNFGDGKINVYDNSGNYQGQLQDAAGNVIVIDGLWSLLTDTKDTPNRIYFTSGPNGEANGRLGYIELKQ